MSGGKCQARRDAKAGQMPQPSQASRQHGQASQRGAAGWAAAVLTMDPCDARNQFIALINIDPTRHDPTRPRHLTTIAARKTEIHASGMPGRRRPPRALEVRKS